MKACELRDQHAKLIDEQRELADRVEAEKRPFTADEQQRSDEVFAEAKKLAETISSIERFEANARMTEADFRRRGEPLPHELEEARGKHSYSLCRAFSLLGKKQPLDGLEKETSDEIERRIGKKPVGSFFMPTNLPMKWNVHRNHKVGGRPFRPPVHFDRQGHDNGVERRIDDTTAASGAVLTRWDTTWIEYLRARMVLDQMGATYMTEMHGNFAMPRQSGIGTVTWVAESGSVATTGQTIDQVLFTPKTVGAFTDMSRRFLEQLSIDPEEFVRQDLAAILARGIESAAYNGTGTPQPTGILVGAGFTQVVPLGTNGGNPTFQSMIQLEELLAKANADIGNLAYVTSPGGRSTLKMTPKQGITQTSYYPIMVWEDGADVNEHDAYATNLIPSNLTKGTGTALSAMIFGNWSDCMLAFWTGVDWLVDPYTGGPAGTIRIVVLQDLDIEFRHFQSFAYINDMVTT
jgi:HK97 family phage major capsid protein